MLYQNWNRTPVYFELAVSASYDFFINDDQYHCRPQVVLQHVDEENAYLCGYLKIKNLTDEYPEMVICPSCFSTIAEDQIPHI